MGSSESVARVGGWNMGSESRGRLQKECGWSRLEQGGWGQNSGRLEQEFGRRDAGTWSMAKVEVGGGQGRCGTAGRGAGQGRRQVGG